MTRPTPRNGNSAPQSRFDIDRNALAHALGAIVEISQAEVALFAQAQDMCFFAKRRCVAELRPTQQDCKNWAKGLRRIAGELRS